MAVVTTAIMDKLPDFAVYMVYMLINILASPASVFIMTGLDNNKIWITEKGLRISIFNWSAGYNSRVIPGKAMQGAWRRLQRAHKQWPGRTEG
jgi:hypothetical protein